MNATLQNIYQEMCDSLQTEATFCRVSRNRDI